VLVLHLAGGWTDGSVRAFHHPEFDRIHDDSQGMTATPHRGSVSSAPVSSLGRS